MNKGPKRRILVAPLDWGLGHATRCVPLIRDFQKQGHEVILTASGRAESYLRQEFPELEFITSPGYNISYSTRYPLWLMMFLQSPGILLNIYKEHQWLQRCINDRKIDEVISDNRYGLWSDKVRCVFITHQVMIKLPGAIKFLEALVHRVVQWFMNKYSESWIPDIEGPENLSGDLSHKYSLPKNAKYIGWLSRFNPPGHEKNENHLTGNESSAYSICFVLSGPEPQRTELENKILHAQKTFNRKVVLIQGEPEQSRREQLSENLLIISHAGQEDLEKIMRASDLIVCRAGYSSIMDLKVLGKNAILIPTPGQTEQEYLADYLSERGDFIKMDQENFSFRFFESANAIHTKNDEEEMEAMPELSR